jgi:hypothetical protein
MRLAWILGALAATGCVGSAPSVPATDAGSNDASSLKDANASADATRDAMTASDASRMDAASDATIDANADANGGDASTFTPADLDAAGSLAFWLESSASNVVLDTGDVAEWTDLSKNHNNALASASARPSVDSAAFNGHDAIAFAHGIDLSITDNASVQFGTDDFAIFAVAKYDEGPDGRAFFFSKAMYTAPNNVGYTFYASGFQFLIGAVGNDGGTGKSPAALNDVNYTGAWNSDVFSDGDFHLVTIRHSGSYNYFVSADGQTPQKLQLDGESVSNAGLPVLIGAIPISGGPIFLVNFELVELVAIHPSNGILPDPVMTSMFGYMKAKYGL